MGVQPQVTRKLSKIQETFVSEFIKHGDGLLAARNAGYVSPETRWQTILESPTIARAILEIKNQRKV